MHPRRLLPCITFASILSYGCALEDPDAFDDEETAVFLDPAGKADGIGQSIKETSFHGQAILALVNSAEFEVLDEPASAGGVGLDVRAVDGIMSLRETDTIDSFVELDAVPYVGPVAFKKLADYAAAGTLNGASLEQLDGTLQATGSCSRSGTLLTYVGPQAAPACVTDGTRSYSHHTTSRFSVVQIPPPGEVALTVLAASLQAPPIFKPSEGTDWKLHISQMTEQCHQGTCGVRLKMPVTATASAPLWQGQQFNLAGSAAHNWQSLLQSRVLAQLQWTYTGAVSLSIDAFQDIDLAGTCPNIQRTLKCNLAVN